MALCKAIGAQVVTALTGRPDEAILEMKGLDEKVFYGG